MKQFFSAEFIMKTTILASALVLVFLGMSFSCSPKHIPSGTVFAHTALTNHQTVCGSISAKNTQFTSLTVYGDRHNPGIADLENCQSSGHINVTGKLISKGNIFNSLSKIGSGELRNTTIKGALSSTGKTTAIDCTLASFSGTGATSFDNTQVQEIISNTGKAKVHNSKCKKLSVTGSVNANNLSCENVNVTGKTELADSSIQDTTRITGKATITNSSLKTLEVTGKAIVKNSSLQTACVTGSAHFTDVKATDIQTTGSLNATKTSSQTCTIVCDSAFFTDCTIETLYVKKQSTIKIFGWSFFGSDKKLKTTVTIYNSPKTPEHRITRIVCDDPSTIIVYKDDSVRAQEIVGTSNVA